MELSAIIARLASFGYIAVPEDNWVLGFLIDKVVNKIRNICNIQVIPEALMQVAIDMVCGEFLLQKKSTGSLEDFDFQGAVKTLKEGDTSVTYAIADDSITFDGFINMLTNGNIEQLYRFRRLIWP